MRSFLITLLVIAAVPLVASCGEEAGPPFLRLNYQVECTGCTGVPARQIETLNGVDNNMISCSVSQIDDTYLLSLSFFNAVSDPSGDFGFDIRNAAVSVSGGPAQSGTITIVEQDNRFSGMASGSALAPGCAEEPPTACPIPCRLYDISFESTPNGPAILGSLQCDGLPLAADRTRTASVHAPTAPTMPANFLFENCTGLQI